jgi:AcrR family transcriptional regulator
VDRRVVRTRAAITSALFELIQERRWDKISVQDLLDRADVSRSTFYAHFDNKLDVLTSGAPDIVVGLVDPQTGRADLLGLFEHVADMADVLGPLLSQPVLGDITAALERGLATGLGEMIDGSESPHVATFVAGALVSTMRDYVTRQRRPPAAEIAAEIEQYLDAVLAVARATQRG